MKIAIVGGGAMGGVWAAQLARSDQQIYIIDVAQDLVDAINTQGLLVEQDGAPQRSRPVATSKPEVVGPVDLVFFFVKAQHTASAARLAQPLVVDGTIVASLQNGWGNADVLAGRFAPAQMVVGVTYHGATVLAPGRVAHTGKGPTYLGPYSDGASLENATRIGQLLTNAGLECTITTRVKTEIWKKLILNAATLPTSALTGLRSGELGQPGDVLDVADALTAEAVHVAQALGYEIDLDERIERIHTILRGAGAGKSSMLQDAEARRKTEIEVINGAVLRAAESLGIDVPLNRAMVGLIHGLERSWRR